MIRHSPSRTATVSHRELGAAAVLLLLAIVLTAIVVPILA
jgi:hypothetical protein